MATGYDKVQRDDDGVVRVHFFDAHVYGRNLLEAVAGSSFRASRHANDMKAIWEDPQFHGMMSAIQMARYGNRAERLRTGAACQASRILRGSSGFKGVSKHGSGWMARIKYECVTYRLGTHPTPELAAMAYNEAAREFYGAAAFQNVIPPI